jgi:hypothetical protein
MKKIVIDINSEKYVEMLFRRSLIEEYEIK